MPCADALLNVSRPAAAVIEVAYSTPVLSDAGRRYQDLHDALDGISHKVLTDTLRRAERDGLSLGISALVALKPPRCTS